MCSEVGMTRKGKLKCRDGSEVSAMATRMSFNVSIESLHDKSYLSLEHCTPQAIVKENHVLHIHDCNNQYHVLLQLYTSKHVCLEREATCLHYLLNVLFYTPKID